MASRNKSPPASPQQPPVGADDDDGLSDTTIEEINDEEEEYNVYAVMAEREEEDGPWFLVFWTGYDLKDATWEPLPHLDPLTLEEWTEQKERIERGEEEPYDVRDWWKARLDHARQRLARSQKRDAKRKKLGLPLTGTTAQRRKELRSLRNDANDAEGELLESTDDDSDINEAILPRPKPVKQPKTQSSRDRKRDSEGTGMRPGRAVGLEQRIKSSTEPSPSIGAKSLVGKSKATAARPRQPESLQATGTRVAPRDNSTPSQHPRQPGSAKPTATSLAPPTKPGKPSSTLLPNRLLIAKRPSAASSSHGAADNIFASGKRVKKRRKLEEVMTDSNMAVKAFSTHRLRRIAEKRSRDKEDRAPAVIPSRLFSISQGPKSTPPGNALAGLPKKPQATKSATSPPVGGSEAPNANVPVTAKSGANHVQHEPVKRPSALECAMRAPVSGTNTSGKPATNIDKDGTQWSVGLDGLNKPNTKPKKKKSVRFSEVDAEPSNIQDAGNVTDTHLTTEPMDIDGDYDGDDGVPMDIDGGVGSSLFVPAEPSPPRELDGFIRDCKPAKPTLRKLSLNEYRPKLSTVSVKKTISFGGSDALKIEVLMDGITKAEKEAPADLIQDGQLGFTHLCSAKDLEFQLRFIAGNKLGSGLVTSTGSSDALENVAARLRLSSLGAVSFREGYTVVVYPTRCDDWKASVFQAESTSPPGVDLRHLIFTRGSDAQPLSDFELKRVKSGVERTLPVGNRELVFQHFFGFDYQSLLPSRYERRTVKLGDYTTHHAFYLAFPPSREVAMNALCQYLRSCDPTCKIYTPRETGSWAAMQETSCSTVVFHESALWALRRFKHISKMLQAGDSNATFRCFFESMRPYPTLPSDAQSRHGPYMEAPGLISMRRILGNGKAVLITPSFLASQPIKACELLKWFSTVVAPTRHTRHTKLVVSHDIVNSLRDLAEQKYHKLQRATRGRPDLLAATRSVTPEECQAGFEAWKIMAELVEESQDAQGLKDEDLFPVVFAPETIEANDEQSLVNWFYWWSIMNLDRFRKFIVLGTSSADIANDANATVITRFPNYRPGTVSDPTLYENWGGREVLGVEVGVPLHGVWRKFPPRQLISSDWFQSVMYAIRNVTSKNKETCILMNFTPQLFNTGLPKHLKYIPPANMTEDMSLEGWFKFLKPFIGGSTKSTYGGFFYPVFDDWDPDSAPQGELPPRHPWLAFYRPCIKEGFLRGLDRSVEIVIWDPLAQSRFPPGVRPTERGLTAAQKQVIRFLSEATKTKNPGSLLHTVWIGPLSGVDHSKNPMDFTLDRMAKILNDPQTELPEGEDIARSNLFRTVLPPDSEYPMPPVEEGQTRPCVFHPPRAYGPVHQGRCLNLLFEAAHEAWPSRGPGREPGNQEFPFRFQATMQWYGEQKEEGRGFEHMFIGPWQEGFKFLDVKTNTKPESPLVS